MSEPNSSDRLSFTIFLAVAVHAMIIFGITFTLSERDKAAPTLNITLATHASANEPDKADFLAQHNQEASGTETELKELTTTEIADVSDASINEINPTPAQQASTPTEREKQSLLSTTAEANRKLTKLEAKNQQSEQILTESNRDSAEARSQKLASLQAKLSQQRQALAREPRITRHTSVSTKSSDEAAYYNYWSDKIIRVGNKNFPKEAIEKGIFGSLRLEVGVKTDGSVASIEITNTSGHSLLDEAARQIVKLAAPFNPLPPEIRKDTDIFVIYRTWNFEITGLSTSD